MLCPSRGFVAHAELGMKIQRCKEHSSYRLRNQGLASISMDSLAKRGLFLDDCLSKLDHVGYEILVMLYVVTPKPTNFEHGTG